MARVHLLLTGLSLSIILLSLNRLTLWTQGYLQPHEFLRFLDFNAMLPIPLISILLYYLLKRTITRDYVIQRSTRYMVAGLFFITGVYLFGAGSGTHEVTNYLNTRFCDNGQIATSLCNIIRFNDDSFSHYVYYGGFVFLNLSLMLLAYFFPEKKTVSGRDLIYVSLNGLVIAVGIFANLAFEDIGPDLFFFASVMLFSLYLLFFRGKTYRKMPVLFYFAVSYFVGVFSTLLYKIFMQ